MKLSDGKCKICSEDENINHLLVECRDVNDIWDKTRAILKDVLYTDLEICTQYKLIGILDETTESILIVNM